MTHHQTRKTHCPNNHPYTPDNRACDEPDERGDFPCCATPTPASGAGLDLDAAEPEPPNAVEVDESGCSCKIGPYRGFQRCPIDPACPKHGEPLRHGDGDVRVFHPDGSTSIIREPSEAEHLESLACAVASVTPCSCSAQRARAEAAEAEVVTLRARLAEGRRIVGMLAETVESECENERDICHEHDRTSDGSCALLADLLRARAALATTGEGQ